MPPAASRNIYTVLPDGTMTAFTAGNAAVLAPVPEHDRGGRGLAHHLRAQPAARRDRGVDAGHHGSAVGRSAARRRTTRRSRAATRTAGRSIWVGTNDGMLHAIDGRLGLEVWAFIPFNLLPKLRRSRRPGRRTSFDFFVDGSPKIADVKVSAPCSPACACWRTYLFFGEGPGGTFYQAFDVTMADMAAVVSADRRQRSTTCWATSPIPRRITFKWAFPRYAELRLHTGSVR